MVVDDDTNICELLRLYLEKEGYHVSLAYDGQEAVEKFPSENPDLMILDVMMPKLDGWQVCREIRKTSNCPIIMLTAKGETMDKVTGLTLGADDYMTKPFLPLELVARVKAQLRRYKTYNQMQEPEDPEGLIIYGGLVLDVESHECTLNERPLVLTPTELPSCAFSASTRAAWSALKNCSAESGVRNTTTNATTRSLYTSVTCAKSSVILLTTHAISKQSGVWIQN